MNYSYYKWSAYKEWYYLGHWFGIPLLYPNSGCQFLHTGQLWPIYIVSLSLHHEHCFDHHGDHSEQYTKSEIISFGVFDYISIGCELRPPLSTGRHINRFWFDPHFRDSNWSFEGDASMGAHWGKLIGPRLFTFLLYPVYNRLAYALEKMSCREVVLANKVLVFRFLSSYHPKRFIGPRIFF